MPYRNEHAARLKDPGQYERFRRQNDKFGKGIDAIFGIKDGKAELQAIRFDASRFTAAQVRKWLKEHDYKPLEFAAASKGESLDGPREVEEMATVDNGTVSKTAWGDVDKGALGRRLAELYVSGDATKGQIREVYAYVPDDAFGTDDDGKKSFERSKAWGPHHELKGETIVLNQGGVHAAAGALAGARAEPSLSTEAKAAAKRHIRRHYRSHLEEEVPDSLKESAIRTIGQGKPVEELVKGSLDYTLHTIQKAFYDQFGESWDTRLYVVEVFSDYLIVNGQELRVDEYYRVPYTREGETFTFAPRDEWEVVQLAYEPATNLAEGVVRQAHHAGGPSAGSGRGEGTRFVESLSGPVRLDEAELGLGGPGAKPDGPWRIKAVGLTADVVNANGRRYPARVLDAAVRDLGSHLQESAGQGRVRQLYGEPEHPSMKAARRPFLSEVVVNWDRVNFDGRQILLEGNLLGTETGKDIRAQMLGGVIPGISQRAYGESHVVEENGARIEEVDWVQITGYDLTVEPSDPGAGVTMFESRKGKEQRKMAGQLNLEQLREEYPELVEQIVKEHDAQKRKLLEEELARRQAEDTRVQQLAAAHEKELREALGLKETEDLPTALKARSERLAELEQKEQERQVAAYIQEQTKELKYPEWMKAQMVESIQASKPKTTDDAKGIIVIKRKEYDALKAKMTLGGKGLDVLGPVLERETGVPEFAQPAHELQESIVRTEVRPLWDPRKPKTINEQFAVMYLEKFDKQYKQHLLREAKLFQEAETASDLNLPYSVARAIVAEAFPQLVTSGIFDFGLTDQSPSRIYYEAFAGETGYLVTVTNEDVTSDVDAWVALANKRVTPGSVVVEPNGGGTAYVEGTDYVIDYANGKFWTISGGNGGTIGDATALDVDYTYTAIRKGEMAVIQQGEVGLTYTTLEIAADRLATQISTEAIVFSRSQLGWDAVARTLNSLVKQVARKIDQGAIYMGLAAALKVASNSGGTWTAASDPYLDFVEKVGVAKVKVMNRFYEPTFLLLSATNADKIANWDGFTQAGARPDADLQANGFMGRLKGLAVFESTQMSDGYALVGNRELVMHRVFQTMQIKGPYPTYDVSGGTSKLLAADQYYAEEFNGTDAPVPQKGAYVKIA